jgi:hypothetical protein
MDNEIKGADSPLPATDEAANISASRRAMLRKLGRFAAITPPAVTLLLAASTRRAAAVISGGISSRQFKEPAYLAPRRRRV